MAVESRDVTINYQKNNFFYYHENKLVGKKSTRVYYQRAVDMIRQKRKYENKNRMCILRDFSLSIQIEI